MPRVLQLTWAAVFLVVLVLIGQMLGLYDVPMLHDLGVPLLSGRAPLAAVEATPTAPPTTVAARPLAASPVPVATDACTATAPRFVQGTAALKAGLGARMGEAIECERVIDAAGDTEQKTTSGLAYYRAGGNIAAFTNGWDHWARTPDGIVHWTGEDLEPPPGAEPAQLND